MPHTLTASEFHGAKRVLALGEFARAALVAYSAGAVLAVFRRSFYVQFGPHALCFGPPGLGEGPVNILVRVPEHVEWPQFSLTPQQKVWSSGTVVSLANRMRFDFANADVWKPPRLPRFSFDDLRAGLRLVSRSALRRSPGGLGAVLVGLDRLPDWPVLPNDPLFRAARTPIRQIAEWILRNLARKDERPPPSTQSLIGLGPGLTPSGDDFICGLLVALNYFGFADTACKLSEAVLPIASRETNIISSQHLRCAAGGHASSALFDALDAMLTCRRLEERLDAIGAIGHTSGWDTLAGAAVVCAAVLESGELIPRLWR